MREFKISKSAEKALFLLEKSGFCSYVVGGAVRDFYMNKIPHDYDIATPALPEETKKVFSDFQIIDTGSCFGTVSIIIDGEMLEITTFRSDGEYLNNRFPENVYFSKKIEDDLKRRDFTVNAIAYSPSCGAVDLFGGEEDIKNEIIRAIGNPDKRFKEDALRIMRALRFSAVMGFRIEEKTRNSVFKNKDLLLNISKERIRDELDKILLSKYAENILLEYREIISVFIPEFKKNEGCLNGLSMCSADLCIRLACLFKDVDTENVSKILKGLKYSNKITKTVKFLAEYAKCDIPKSKTEIKRYLNKFGAENTEKLIKLKIAISKAKGENLISSLEVLYEIIKSNECFMIKDLKINGKDLMLLGFSGRKIGEVLEILLEEVIEERLKNEKEKLLEYVKNM